MYGHAFMGHGFFMPGFIFWIVILGMLFAVFSYIVDKRKKTKNSDEKALFIAKKRFANGDISEEEYKNIKNILL
ncbi:SHOCT domain-containing protein [Sulfurospirillum arcachonense]|uniref:SHOCT domain-containing protein n=1 Tax=Sulfurospirillum arcachonense TaxID=57666 RepID=UPI00046953C6|nr:SHOCT domain-containing protein [Sulfurospirillum arcachonense]